MNSTRTTSKIWNEIGIFLNILFMLRNNEWCLILFTRCSFSCNVNGVVKVCTSGKEACNPMEWNVICTFSELLFWFWLCVWEDKSISCVHFRFFSNFILASIFLWAIMVLFFVIVKSLRARCSFFWDSFNWFTYIFNIITIISTVITDKV